MYRFLLTPRWWGIHVFALLAIPLCVFMGTWQLSRFEEHAHEGRTAASEEHPGGHREKARPLASLLPVSESTAGHQGSVTGRYDRQFLVPHRQLNGRDGSYVVTLLRTDGGRALPVVRGWLPGTPRATALPAPPSGQVTVVGAVQASETPDTDGVSATGGLPHDELGMISAASLVNLVPYRVYDAWLTLNTADSGMRAVPPVAAEGSGLDLKAFQNLGYTGEWFVFAGFVVFMWFRLLRREVEAVRDARLGLPVEGPEPTGADPAAPVRRDGEDGGKDTQSTASSPVR